MIERVTEAFLSHKNTVNVASEIFNESVDIVKSNYIGAMYAEKYREVKELYNQTIAESKKVNYEICFDVISEIEEKFTECVNTPISDDISNNIECMKKIKNLTISEKKMLKKSCENNYIAYRMISDVIGDESCFTVEFFNDVMDGFKQTIKNAFRTGVNSYLYNLVLNEDFISKYDSFFTACCESRFDEALKIMI